MTSQWKRVTQREPCAICKNVDWCKCSTTSPVRICRRVPGGLEKVDARGARFWVYGLTPGATFEAPVSVSPKVASVETRHRVYSFLLDRLTLSREHREYLCNVRGLSTECIERVQFRTWPLRGRADLARQVAECFGADPTAQTPGLIIKKGDNEREYWSLAGPPGILIPAWDLNQQIPGCIIRPDEPGEDLPKYLWLSSSHYDGPSPGALLCIPPVAASTDRIRITEGLLKSIIASDRSGELTLGLPSVSACVSDAINAARQLKARTVALALDADASSNRHVGQALRYVVEQLWASAADFAVELELWDPDLGKGIDDLLLAGHRPTVYRGADVLRMARGIEAEAKERDPMPEVPFGSSNGHQDPEEVALVLEDARGLVAELADRAKEDAGAPFQPEAVRALALVKTLDAPLFQRIRSSLKGTVSLRDLDGLIKAEAARLPKGPVPESGQDAPKVRTVGDLVADAPAASTVIPHGYGINEFSTYAVTSDDQGQTRLMPIAPAPIYISALYRDTGDGTESVLLNWKRGGRWHKHIAPRSVITTARKLNDTLAPYGLPVNDANALELVKYLSAEEAANIGTMPVARVSSQMGWQGSEGTDGFLWGSVLITPSGLTTAAVALDDLPDEGALEDFLQFNPRSPGEEQLAKGLHSAGSMERWLAAVELAADFPRVILALYTSLAAPLLMVLGSKNFTADWSGPSSKGKTTALRVGASAWGNPDEEAEATVVHKWNSTRVFIEHLSAVFSSLPVFLDDTATVKNPDQVRQVLYDVASGQGRGRGSRDGLRQTAHWRTILHCTGESAATSFSPAGGAQARTLTLWGLPFGRADESTALVVNKLDIGLRSNYGHAGPEFVRWLLAHRDEWPAWREEYERVQYSYIERAKGDSVVSRYAAYFAVIDMAAALAHAALPLPWAYKDPLEHVWQSVVREAENADRSAVALSSVMAWARSRQTWFYGRHETIRTGADFGDGCAEEKIKRPPQGWLGRWDRGGWDCVGFIGNTLRKHLSDQGFEPDAIIRTWKDREWLKTSGKSGGEKGLWHARLDGEPQWMIALRKDAIENVDGSSDAAE